MKIIGVCEDPSKCNRDYLDDVVSSGSNIVADYVVDLTLVDLILDPREFIGDKMGAYYADFITNNGYRLGGPFKIIRGDFVGKDLKHEVIRYIPKPIFKVRE
jgi:hypothetical protein